ncbi:MAG: hypothetical protein R3290_10205 [Acidimicrobiia bacterium]|nr:hypothetical protein [Acidimicrobiia bacterium]
MRKTIVAAITAASLAIALPAAAHGPNPATTPSEKACTGLDQAGWQLNFDFTVGEHVVDALRVRAGC